MFSDHIPFELRGSVQFRDLLRLMLLSTERILRPQALLWYTFRCLPHVPPRPNSNRRFLKSSTRQCGWGACKALFLTSPSSSSSVPHPVLDWTLHVLNEVSAIAPIKYRSLCDYTLKGTACQSVEAPVKSLEVHTSGVSSSLKNSAHHRMHSITPRAFFLRSQIPVDLRV